MNNPQHYQPLAHALHQPAPTSPLQGHPSYKPSSMYQSQGTVNHERHNREEEEEDEDDPDDGDEGLVEEQLNPPEPELQGSSTSAQSMPSTRHNQNSQTPQQKHSLESTNAQEQKRRPGRPRGSKNRKPRAVSQGAPRQDPAPAAQPPIPPQHSEVNAQSQQFYEFQWRILNLCAEFYGAAEELVKSTSPLILAHCYQAGSDSTQDPLKMLTEAKRICDNLLANPSRFALNATAVYPTLPSNFQAPPAPPAPSASSVQSVSAGSTAPSKASTPMITNPQSFVVSLGTQPAYPHTQYSMFPAAQYPAPYYHQYSYAPPTAAFYQQQAVFTTGQSQLQASPLPQSAAPSALPNVASNGLLNQGAWSEEETEKLRKLAEESRSFSSGGEIDWDKVVSQYGNGRTRHQILIKATALGLKESSTRGTKRRREAEDDVGPSGPAPPPPQHSNTNSASNVSVPSTASPAHSHAGSTPINSPALQHQQNPQAAKGSTQTNTTNLPWPMPTVAVNTPSPVMSASSVSQDQNRTSYYRPRTSQDAIKPLTHNYVYQSTNGSGVSGSRLGKENGK